MPGKSLFRLTLFSLGIALLFAGLFFDNGRAARALQAATPTPDRLAEPTLPPNPSQADLGAQVYWLSCLPCHGDRGQGLTDEFRQTYPPEDQYCWESGCHGERPYDNGFKLPKTIPAVAGPQALTKFENGAQLQAYIRATMPYWKPGSLTDDEAWKVTSYLLRLNGLWDGVGELGAENASQVKIQSSLLTPTSVPAEPASSSKIGLVPPVVILVLAALIGLLHLLFGKTRPRESS